MKTVILAGLLFLVGMATGNVAWCQEEPVKVLERARSPDGLFSAELDVENLLTITNNKTGRKYKPLETTSGSPLKWTGNSKSLVFVEQGRGGQSVTVLRMHGDEWVPVGFDPTTDFFCSVIRESVKYDTVRLTYVTQSDDKAHLKYHIISLVFHPGTATYTSKKVKIIDEATYRHLRWGPLVEK